MTFCKRIACVKCGATRTDSCWSIYETPDCRIAQLEAELKETIAIALRAERDALLARLAELTEAGNYLAAEAESDWNSGHVSIDLWGAVCSWRKTLVAKEGE